MTILLNNVSVDTTSKQVQGNGKQAVLMVRGELGGAKLKLQTAPSNDTENQSGSPRFTSGGDITEAQDTVFINCQGILLRVALVGATASTSEVYVELIEDCTIQYW